MKKGIKYYNDRGELFKLDRGTIKEIKDYYGRTQVFLAYNDESKSWHCSLAMGFMEEDGPHYNRRITWGTELNKKGLAELCNYYYDEAGDVIL